MSMEPAEVGIQYKGQLTAFAEQSFTTSNIRWLTPQESSDQAAASGGLEASSQDLPMVGPSCSKNIIGISSDAIQRRLWAISRHRCAIEVRNARSLKGAPAIRPVKLS